MNEKLLFFIEPYRKEKNIINKNIISKLNAKTIHNLNNSNKNQFGNIK